MSAPKETPVAHIAPDTLAEIAEKSSRLLAAAMERQAKAGAGHFSMGDEMGIAKAFFDLTARMMADPMKLAEVQLNLWKDYMTLWQGAMMRMLGIGG